jgi:hypothetical protein
LTVAKGGRVGKGASVGAGDTSSSLRGKIYSRKDRARRAVRQSPSLLLACLLARVLVRFRSSFSLVVVSVVVVVVAKPPRQVHEAEPRGAPPRRALSSRVVGAFAAFATRPAAVALYPTTQHKKMNR